MHSVASNLQSYITFDWQIEINGRRHDITETASIVEPGILGIRRILHREQAEMAQSKRGHIATDLYQGLNPLLYGAVHLMRKWRYTCSYFCKKFGTSVVSLHSLVTTATRALVRISYRHTLFVCRADRRRFVRFSSLLSPHSAKSPLDGSTFPICTHRCTN